MAKNYRVAVIPGDGIGKRGRARGHRGAGGGGAALRLRLRMARIRLELRDLRQDRPDDAGGRARPAAALRRDLPRRGRLSRRARPRLAVGPADPDPPQLPAVHQSAAGAAAAGRRVAARRTARPATSTSMSCARTTRASTPRSAAGSTRAPTTRWRCSRPSSPGAAATGSCATPSSWPAPARSTSPRRPSRTASSTPCRTGTSASRRSPREYPDVKTDQYHIDILTAHFVRHPDWFDVVVGSNLFGDILSDLGPAVRRLDRHRAVRQHQPGARVPVDVRAGARLGARHRRARHRQSDRPDLVGRDDARPSRRERGGGRRSSGRSPRCWPRAAPAPPISAATPAPRTSAPRSPRRSAEPGSRPSLLCSVAERRASALTGAKPKRSALQSICTQHARPAASRVIGNAGWAAVTQRGQDSGGRTEHVSIESTGRRRPILLPAILLLSASAAMAQNPAAKGRPAGLQARHRPVLQSGPAGRRPHQGVHEREHPGPFRPLQGSPLPGLAASLKRQGVGPRRPSFGCRLIERTDASGAEACLHPRTVTERRFRRRLIKPSACAAAGRQSRREQSRAGRGYPAPARRRAAIRRPRREAPLRTRVSVPEFPGDHWVPGDCRC